MALVIIKGIVDLERTRETVPGKPDNPFVKGSMMSPPRFTG